MPGHLIGRFITMIVLLVIEVFLTLLTYTFLNLYAQNTWFGYLVGISGSIADGMKKLLLTMIPSWANAVNATLVGDLNPKAVLLLLIGLVVAAIVRSLAELTGLTGRHA